ncbi:fatty acyl-CoA reductase 2, chloroplastic isoform X2 [Ziziphus jujuba]|uniref:Fatty acyl-CoA reductase n=1 Tax=Ziziphus jujuba TaxID=326968 RepID=A0ABM3I6G8_ZIZJJ|nr:fatty acyl-CoA reductase 2, chloroplastic isoform X2 [Ziziphus jujuba]
MSALFLNTFSFVPKEMARVSLRKNKNTFFCHGGGNDLIKTNGISYVLTKRSPSDSLARRDHSNASEIAENYKMVPCARKSSTSLLEINDGIGIVKFLRGKRFFITGATGFLAKVLIEKVLRTVPDVGKIYVLIKAKNKEAAMERLKSEIINAELFKCLQQTHGKSYQTFMLEKLIPVLGNISEPDLGLEEELAEMMAKEVDVIVNSAATINFDERYDVALDINTRGPGHLMCFAKKCKRLELFVQVSTAYVNGQRQGRIMEKPFCIGESIAGENISETSPTFHPKLDIENEINLCLASKKAFVNNATQKMKQLGLERAKKYGWHDTYVFTKAMGEMMIDSIRDDIPVVIIRPGSIESTLKEPFPGWIQGNKLMDPIVLYYGKGQLTGFPADPNAILDVVPADMVVNAMLAAMAKQGFADRKPDMNVYQITSSVANPLPLQDLARLSYEHYNSSPCMDSHGRPIKVSPMMFFHSMEAFDAHLWKDTVERSSRSSAMTSSNHNIDNRSPKLEMFRRRIVERAKNLAKIYEPYTFYTGRFDCSNTATLMESMCEEEKMEFGFDLGSIEWSDYIKNIHIPGLGRHVIKGV